jgi:hypothetical protein
VGEAVVGGERVGTTVADAEHGVFNRHAREVRTDLHRRPGGEVVGLCQDRFEVWLQMLPRGHGGHATDGVRLGADVAFDRVGEGVDARGGGGPAGLGSKMLVRKAAFLSPQAILRWVLSSVMSA